MLSQAFQTLTNFLSTPKKRRWNSNRLHYRQLTLEMFEYRILLAGVDVVTAPANYEFRDMGFDATTGEVGIVGYEVAGAVKTAKLFELNAAKNGFVAQTLVGLGNPTYVYGISSDASRIAGVSKSAGSIDRGEGTTWTRSAPSAPVGIGYASGCANYSDAYGAWKDGVVGNCGGRVRLNGHSLEESLS